MPPASMGPLRPRAAAGCIRAPRGLCSSVLRFPWKPQFENSKGSPAPLARLFARWGCIGHMLESATTRGAEPIRAGRPFRLGPSLDADHVTRLNRRSKPRHCERQRDLAPHDGSDAKPGHLLGRVEAIAPPSQTQPAPPGLRVGARSHFRHRTHRLQVAPIEPYRRDRDDIGFRTDRDGKRGVETGNDDGTRILLVARAREQSQAEQRRTELLEMLCFRFRARAEQTRTEARERPTRSI